ncbi:MAG TPA: thioredoxin family protein [Verrucomicrobiae bacterium]|nr:thioredoxin family protein [Verrucomicrobiae bacterium]
MKSSLFIASLLVLWTWSCRADDIVPLLSVKGQVYTNATVIKVTDTDVYFSSGQGLGNAKLKDLAPDLQKHFHYDAAKAARAEQAQTTANSLYRTQLASQPVRRAPREMRDPPAANPTNSKSLSWQLHLPAALDQARKEKKQVLLDFTGSDWCPWCIKFDHEILDTAKFAEYANRHLVLVQLDYPRNKPQSESLRRDNAELQQRFQVEGFPTFVLLNSDGKELGRQVGFLEGGPDAFIRELDKFAGH